MGAEVGGWEGGNFGAISGKAACWGHYQNKGPRRPRLEPSPALHFGNDPRLRAVPIAKHKVKVPKPNNL